MFSTPPPALPFQSRLSELFADSRRTAAQGHAAAHLPLDGPVDRFVEGELVGLPGGDQTTAAEDQGDAMRGWNPRA